MSLALRTVLTPYRRLLATPGALGFTLTGLVARMPISMVGIGTVLLVEDATGSYGTAGAVAAALPLAGAVAQPRVAQLVDRLGQRRVTRPALAVHVAGLLALVGLAGAGAAPWTYFVAAVLAGASMPPVGAMVRARWSNLLGGTPLLAPAFSFESVLDEVIFIVGPVLVTVLATGVSTPLGLLAATAFALVGTLGFLSLRRTEPAPSPLGSTPGRSALRVPAVVVLSVVSVALGALFGAVEVATVAVADESGTAVAAGPLLAVFALGSLLAGVLVGARSWGTPLQVRFRLGVTGLALGLVPTVVAPSLPVLGAVLFVAGLAIAPTIISAFALIEALAAPGTLTEALTWASTGLGVGIAVGSSVTGQVVDLAGGQQAYVVAIGSGALAAALAWATARWLRG